MTVGPYAGDVLIRACFMESHPVGVYTNARIRYVLIWYKRKGRDSCVGVW